MSAEEMRAIEENIEIENEEDELWTEEEWESFKSSYSASYNDYISSYIY